MKKNTLKSFIILAFLLFSTTFLFAVPAFPDPIVVTQPNGETLTVFIKGDERINWYESLDGYTLLSDKDKYLTYAQLDEAGDLQPSEFIATDIDKRNIVASFYLSTIEKKLFYSDYQVQLRLKIWEIEDEALMQRASGDNRITGTYKTICAFVQFPDRPMVKTMSDFEGLLNGIGYTGSGAFGSVRDFFRESSYGQFDLIITLCGIYTTPQNLDIYVSNTGTLAKWLAEQVAKELDFNDYDSDGNGEVDGFHLIFAGYGKESSPPAYNAIWSHKSQITPVWSDGKFIRTYSCSPELRSNSGTNITTIGVICHEMSHAFGALDYYDTNGSTGGEYPGTGNWDIMAAGTWNGSPSGSRPAHHNMHIKTQVYKWVTAEELKSKTTITNMPNSAENPIAYRINTTTTNEYFLLENRQRVKFDTNLPGSGLIIYRVHSGWGVVGNCINCTHPQRMYVVCANTNVELPTSAVSSYGGTYGINTFRTPFPLLDPSKTEFTDNSLPSMKAWNGNNTNKYITNIKHENGLISFDFMHNVGIDDVENNTTYLKVTPNPANEYVDVQFSTPNIKADNVDFYNINGQLVKSVPFKGVYNDNVMIQRISVADLSQGFYFIKVGNETTKLVIQ